MFEWIASLYTQNSEFLNGVAVTLTIIGFAATLIVAATNRLSVIRTHFRAFKFERQELPDGVEVSYKTTSTSVTGGKFQLDHHVVVNRTKTVLLDEVFAKPVEVTLKPGTVIYYARLIELPNSGSAEVQVDLTEHSVRLFDLRIPRKSGIALEIAHDGGASSEISMEPKSLREPSSYTLRRALNRPTALFSILMLMLLPLAYVLEVSEGIDPLIIRFIFVIAAIAPFVYLASYLFDAPEKDYRISRAFDKFAGLLPFEDKYLEEISYLK